MTGSDPTRPRLEVLTAHVAWVRRLASRLVRDPGTAEDLAQESEAAQPRHGRRVPRAEAEQELPT